MQDTETVEIQRRVHRMASNVLIWTLICVPALMTLCCAQSPSKIPEIVGLPDDRSFVIDYQNDRFLKDGQPFRYISGSLHYFRVPRVYWQDRLDKCKAVGLNAIEVYVEWSSHEPESEQYNFEDGLDLVEFLRMANETGLLVILRPGPYICAERDFGGFPYWILHEDPNMRLRSSDPSYLKYVDRWWTKLFSLLTPMLYINGGPIISIQVENEYGSYFECDSQYTQHLRNLLRLSLVGEDVVLFTTDGNSVSYLRCGKIPGVYATVDFGDGADVAGSFRAQRDFEPRGPYVNSEYYTGWLDLWGNPHIQLNATNVATTLDEILAMNASVNLYMFHGGTNFGFTSGAELGKDGILQPVPTSYDYDAPLNEAGDPSELYTAVRNVIAKYSDVPPGPVPPASPKQAYGIVHLQPLNSIFGLLDAGLGYGPPVIVDYPISFEALGQASGFILYSTVITGIGDVGAAPPMALLEAPGIHDRGYVFVDKVRTSVIFSRMEGIYSQNITIGESQTLYILVENQGRTNYGSGLKDFKGIVSNVTLDGRILTGWTLVSIPLNQTNKLDLTYFNDVGGNVAQKSTDWRGDSYVPTLFAGDFVLTEGQQAEDTFLDPTGWQKGVAFLNDFNLGRYWPVKGPQVTLYVPKSVIRPSPEVNRLLVLELEAPPSSQLTTMNLTDAPILDGPIIVGDYL